MNKANANFLPVALFTSAFPLLCRSHFTGIYCLSLAFNFGSCCCCTVCVSVWFFVFLLIGYVFLDECINRDVYFRVFDYFFVVVARVTQSILIIWKNGRARKHRQNHFTFDSMFVWFFFLLFSVCKIPCQKKMFVCVLNTCVHLAKWFHISSISGCTENKSSFMHAERRVRERVSFFLHSNHSISRQYQ